MRPRSLSLHYRTLLSLKRLLKEAEQDGEYRVALRIRAVLLNAEGRTSGEIADVLQAPRSKVSEWLQNYEIHALDGLLEGNRSGRPRGLTDKQTATLGDIIDSGPVAYGFLSGVWTSVMIARIIAEEFGLEYHPGHVRKMLHQLDFSVQRPKRALARADPKKQAKWRRYTYPRIKKKPKS